MNHKCGKKAQRLYKHITEKQKTKTVSTDFYHCEKCDEVFKIEINYVGVF